MSYLESHIKEQCFGCEACEQICPVQAICMIEDEEGFRYPLIETERCIHCQKCQAVCPYVNMPEKHGNPLCTFGGYHKDVQTRFESTSGGAFSAIVDSYCDENYVIFGATSKGLLVFHSYITDKKDIDKFRKSKYSQSIIGGAYRKAKKFLAEGKKVLFSGTPCQIAGLKAFLGCSVDQERLLTVEVICEGVPSPLYMRKLDNALLQKYGSPIAFVDYRYTDKTLFSHGKWDFQEMKIDLLRGGGGIISGKWDFEVMMVILMDKKRVLKIDRWFNPFWSIWLGHLMSRPSCYHCPFATQERTADITLGDLWGVHLYCPELYGNNGGSSLVIANTEKGKQVVQSAEKFLYGHELVFEDALKYQSPMRKTIDFNPNREHFMADLKSDISYKNLNRKWAKKPSLRLLWQKYVWGNRQKVAFWKLRKKFKSLCECRK